ncbi:MAG: restriction endonuclease subunit S [Gammaproteobacteria bacterium]|nr:restriction endonuclease subunit S [Gammaproteobacteria bacterium]
MTDWPPGWASAPLREICAINPRVDKNSIDTESVVSFVPMPAVEAGTGKIDVSETRSFGAVRKGYTPFRKGDILFAKITPCMENGKMAVVPDLVSEHGFGSTEFHVLRPADGVDQRFIYRAVSNRAFRFHAEHNMTGAVGQKRVPATILEEHQIGLPPTNEQRRIADRIETLFDEIDRGVASLRAAKGNIDLYRQSLLKSAFEGRLTADWRAENREKLESPDALLARISEERESSHKRGLDDWQKAVDKWRKGGEKGRKPARPRRAAHFEVKTKAPTDVATSTPRHWLWLSLFELGQVTGGLTKNPSRNALPRKAKYLRVANVYSNRLALDEIMEIGLTEDELRKTRLSTGDLLFVEGNGSIEQIGRVAIWDGSVPSVTHQNHLIRFSTNGLLSSRFALYFMMSPIGRKLVTAQASSTSGLHTLSITKVGSLPIPICSPAEQAEIIGTLDDRLEAAEALDAEIEASLARAEALRQAILKKAFSGELVPQDPDDEPAQALLARIRASRDGDATTKPRTRARRPASATVPR